MKWAKMAFLRAFDLRNCLKISIFVRFIFLYFEK